MKKILTLFTFCTLATLSLSAQKLEVTYRETVQVNQEEFKKNIASQSSGSNTIPKDLYDNIFQKVSEPKDFTLSINDNESTYKKIEKLSNGQNSGNQSFSVVFAGEGKGLYKNLTNKEYSKNVNLMDKVYLVKDKLTEFKWQLSRETKKIIGFDVKKATAVIDSTKTITAWYAPSLAVKDGPALYTGLPGLILELELRDSKNKTIEANIIKAIEVKEVPELKPIEKPKEKNVITEKEFKELSDKQMERLKEMRSEGIDKKD